MAGHLFSMNSPILAPSRYAGIAEASRPGMPVDECAGRLARFAAVQISLVEIAAGRMTGIPEWEIKAAFARWMWEDATNFGILEKRLTELRSNKSAVGKVRAYQLGDFFQELLHTPDTLALSVGIFEVLLPDCLAAIREYLASTQPLVDQPTIRILKALLAEQEEKLALGRQFLGTFDAGRREFCADWKAHLQAFLDAASGVWGREMTPAGSLKSRAKEEFRISRTFARDERFKTTILKTPPGKFTDDNLKMMMWIRSQEMTAAEMVASVIYEWEDLPTQAIIDLSRHCWDEVRHSLFGCAALETEGIDHAGLENWVGYAGHTLSVPPPKRYSHLAIASEAAAMAYPGGKRGEWEFCRDQAHHPLMTTFQDFDWADEITHVNYGRKWLIEYHCRGDRELARKMADETVEERTSFYAQNGASAAAGTAGNYTFFPYSAPPASPSGARGSLQKN